MDTGMTTGSENSMTTRAAVGVGWQRWARESIPTGFVAGALVLAIVSPGAAWGQAADRVNLFGGTSVSGKIVSVSPVGVDVENSDGDAQKVAIETVREVQFGAEPQSLKNARAMLLRGRGADARDEVGKIEADELDGAEPLVLAEVDFVRAAAAAQAVLEAGGDPATAAKTVADYLAKHPKSHHFFQMQELLGDLHARAGKPAEALAAYQQLDSGPPGMKVRAASAKAAMLLSQGKPDEAMAEYDAAIKLAGSDKASQPQKRSAELGKARCLSLQGKQDPAIEMVLQIIKDSGPEEKELLSRAYNVLGGAYRSMAGREQDALIQFLTVDLVYNTLPESHAEALFNLGELWDKGSNPERAREARQNLKAAYPASPWAAKLEASKS
jgi:tetratricopeptide (TPR) repeat protein